MDPIPFDYNISFGKIAWLLYAKKTCPKCGGILKKTECHQTVDVHAPDMPPDQTKPISYSYYHFVCPNCHSAYSAQELLNQH